MRVASLVGPAGLVAVGVLLQAWNLGHAPLYLTQDEAFFGITAHSIAVTGRDLNGDFLPLYFRWPPQLTDNIVFQPVLVYFSALFLTLLPLSEATIRLPTVAVGITNAILMYFIGRRIYTRRWLALLASVLLLLTPAHFIHSRLAMDYLYPVPFILAWLLCLLHFAESDDARLLFVGTMALGLGFYSYIAAVVMMPIYVALTLLVLLMYGKPLRCHVIALAGFALPLLPIVPWLLHHPDAVALTTRRYELYDAAKVTAPLSSGLAVWRALRQSLRFFAITDRVTLYWTFFNPSYLFLTGAVKVVNSTRFFGVFLLPLAVFLPVGVNQMLNARRSPVTVLLLLGFVTAPIAACLIPEAYAIERELPLLPFAVLIAVFGVEALLLARQRIWRLAGVGLLAVVPLQFAFFYLDYMGDYRVRSAGWFGGNIKDGLEEIILHEANHTSPAIYLSAAMPYAEWQWRFQLIAHGRDDLFERTRYVDTDTLDIDAVPTGSVLLVKADEPACAAWTTRAPLKQVRLIPGADGSRSLCLFEKT